MQTQPRSADGRFAEKPEVGLARRLTDRLREALGHDGHPEPPADPPQAPSVPVAPSEPQSLTDLYARLDAQSAAPVAVEAAAPPEPEPLDPALLREVPTLASAAVALGVDTVPDAARALVSMGKSAPTHLLADAIAVLETKDLNADGWDPKLHPRDKNGRFIEVGAVLNLLGSVGGGSGTVVGNGPNNHVIVRKTDGSTVDVPANQTYSADAPAPGKPGTPGQAAAGFASLAGDKPDKPDAKPEADPDRVLPADLPNEPDALFRALYSVRPVGNDNTRMAVNAAASAIGSSGDGKETGRALAARAGDQRTNDRIAEMMGDLTKIADELDADGITVTNRDGQKLSDYLRDYADGFNETHQGRINVTDQAAADKPKPRSALREFLNSDAAKDPSQLKPQGGEARNALYDSVTDRQREQIDKLTDEQRAAYYEARLRRQQGHAPALAAAKKPAEPVVSENVVQPDSGVPDTVGGPEMSRAGARGATVSTEPDAADPATDLSSLRDRRMALRQAAAAADEGDYERSDAILARLPERAPTDTGDVTPATPGDAAVANRGGAVMPASGPPGVRPQVDALDPQLDVAQLRGRREALRQAADAAARGDYNRADSIIARLAGNSTANPGRDALADLVVDGKPDATGTPDDPIDVEGDIDRALELIADGKHVRLNQPNEVATLLDKMREMVAEAKAQGQDAPIYDLCNVSVPGTNLFCAEHKGIPRIKMPQLSGIPLPGTPADSLDKNEYGGVDVTDQFIDALNARGINVTDATVPASHLRASQMELEGGKVSGIAKGMAEGTVDPNEPIFVTRDGYVVDGHHRWAAKVGMDTTDNSLGDVMMNVRVIDMDIGAALDAANDFTKAMGIPGQSAADNPVEDATPSKPDTIEYGGEKFTKADSLYAHLVPDGNGGYVLTPERKALHDRIVTEALQGVPESSDPTLFMLGGGPAAGKSTMLGDKALEGVPDDEGMLDGKLAAVVVNPDNVKQVLPEYGAMIEGGQAKDAAGHVHEESSILAKRIQATALEGKRDVVLDGTGDSSLMKLLKKIDQAREKDYKVKGFYATVPTDVAWERADARAQQTGRHVRESVLRDTHSAVSRVVPQAASRFDEFTLFDTMDGAVPIARATRDGEIEVLDEDGYAAFLDKGFEGVTESVESLQSRLDQTTSPALRAALQRQIDAIRAAGGGGDGDPKASDSRGGATDGGRADGVDGGSGGSYTSEQYDQALIHYKGNTYRWMNQWLREGQRPAGPAEDQRGMWVSAGGAMEWQPLSEAEFFDPIEQDIAALTDYIHQHPTTKPITVYRGAQGDWTTQLAVGSVINDLGFTSASEDQEIALGFALGELGMFRSDQPGAVIQIDMPTGTAALNYGEHDPENEFEADDGEEEWIIAPGSRIEIVRDDGVDDYGARVLIGKLVEPMSREELPEAA